MTHELRFTASGPRCVYCGGREGTLTTACPVQRLSRCAEDCIWAGVLDFKDGEWKLLRGTEAARRRCDEVLGACGVVAGR